MSGHALTVNAGSSSLQFGLFALDGLDCRATGIVDIDSMQEPLRHRFGVIAAKNEDAMRAAYDHVSIMPLNG